MAGFFVENFGCRAARADGEAVSARLRTEGLTELSLKDADVVIVNTCSVTAEADRVARAFIRRTHRQNPAARIVVTGCYAQRAPEELAALAGVRAVVGNSHKALTPAVAAELAVTGELAARDSSQLVPVQALLGRVHILADDRFAHSFLEEAQVLPYELPDSNRQTKIQTRPNLKIQEGCNNRCTFCVIPQTRGSSRSLSSPAIMRQIEGFVAAGGKELVLSGINLGRWGRDSRSFDERAALLPTLSTKKSEKEGAPSDHGAINIPAMNFPETNSRPQSLATLVRFIFTETSLECLRLSSIEPMDWTDELIGLMNEFGGSEGRSRFARHAHLPLQSGSDAVLRRMHRRYRPWHYVAKVEALLKAAGPELTLGADVMVGFPGETDEEFEETCALIRSLPLGYLHLFPFSPRPGTRGWALHIAAPVAPAVVEDRMTLLRALATEKMLSHRRQFVGRELQAITLESSVGAVQAGRTAALTENFLPVELASRLPRNQMVRLRVTDMAADGTLAGQCC